jgi:hypothetical protein
VHRSRSRHLIEWLLAESGAGVQRCHDCNARYARLGSSMIRLRDLRKLSSALCFSLAMAAAVMIIVLAISWVGHREAAAVDVGCTVLLDALSGSFLQG